MLGGGRFRLVRRLGEGGMGTVWLAVDEKLSTPGKEVLRALKFLGDRVGKDARAVERLRKEVVVMQELAHPNVVKVYDLFEVEGEPIFYSMEYVAGEDLRRRLASHPRGRFTVGEIQAWVLQIVSALSFCHDTKNLTHRDLKPANLVVAEDGNIRVVDFGLAHLRSADGEVLGESGMTRAYASPEQIEGKPGTATDDIYSLGAVLYHLLTGRAPAPNGQEVEDPRQVLMAAVGQAGDVTPEIAQTVMDCISPAIQRRPATMDQFLKRWQVGRDQELAYPIAEPEEGSWAVLVWLAVVLMVVVGAVVKLGVWNKVAEVPPNNGSGTNVASPVPGGGGVTPPRRHPVMVELKGPGGSGSAWRLSWRREGGKDGDEPGGVDLSTAGGLVTTELSLEEGVYRFRVQGADARYPERRVERVVMVPGQGEPLRFNLVPTELRMVLENDVGLEQGEQVLWLVSEHGDRHPIRLADLIPNGRRNLWLENDWARLIPGRYRMELVERLRDDWRTTEPSVLEVGEVGSQSEVVVLNRRQHPLIDRPWTNGMQVYLPLPKVGGVLGCVTETTVRDYARFVEATGRAEVSFKPIIPGATPDRVTWRTAIGGQGPDHPVVGVSWEDAMAYAAWLTENDRKAGRLTGQQSYRLPTDAEWTLMAGDGLYPWGDRYPPTGEQANLAGYEMRGDGVKWPLAWSELPFTEILGEAYTEPAWIRGVGRTPFRHMGGNVSEWCLDDYRDEMNTDAWAKEEVAVLRREAAPGQVFKVIRGGSWFQGREGETTRPETHERVGRAVLTTTRMAREPGFRKDYIGFRLVVEERR